MTAERTINHPLGEFGRIQTRVDGHYYWSDYSHESANDRNRLVAQIPTIAHKGFVTALICRSF